jgi:hypothetical protein
MTTYIVLFVAQFCFVATKAFQQLNVMHHKTVWVFWTSAVMSVFECGVYGAVTFKAYEVVNGGDLLSFMLLAIPLWLGGSLGSILSMAIHRRMRDARHRNNSQ